MSWLSPKRRRTTGNLKTYANGQIGHRASGSSAPNSPSLERPSTVHRPLTLPNVGDTSGEGNLFYAYARKGDDLNSRYLLTFASASVANEWWLLLQLHFPDTSRPGPQLFSWKTDDLLPKAWKHESFSHLKSKWMYIPLSDDSSQGLGGAAQSIIPVQDAQGNVVGGTASNSEDAPPGIRQEVKDVQREVGRLEEYIGTMMEALERNTAKSAELAAKIVRPGSSREAKTVEEKGTVIATTQKSVDSESFSTHFESLSQALNKNSQNVETLAKKHYENEQKLHETMEAMASKQDHDRIDMQQLSSHLDRIQNMMEDSAKERKDSARELLETSRQIDFSPLTQRLEKVQEAIEENSALIRSLLEEGGSGTDTKDQPAQLDLAPLNDTLQRIHSAVEQQAEHTKALVGYASGESEGNDSGIGLSDRNLTPLSEHLEQIYNAIEEGNKHAKESQQSLDLSPLERHFEDLKEHGRQSSAHMERLVEGQDKTREAVEANGGELDFTPLAEHLEAIRDSNDANTEALKRLVDVHSEQRDRDADSSPMLEQFTNDLSAHLTKIQSITEQNAKQIKSLREKHSSSDTRMQAAVSDTSEQVRKLVEKNRQNESKIEAQNSQMRELMSGQREMVDVMRQLAKSIVAQNKQSCDHIVVPPPRKMNKKLVGFVYDTKDGMP